MRFWLKACPKCGGDLEAKTDVSGPYIECIQCGAELNPKEQAALLRYGYVARMTPLAAPRVVIEGRRHSA